MECGWRRIFPNDGARVLVEFMNLETLKYTCYSNGDKNNLCKAY